MPETYPTAEARYRRLPRRDSVADPLEELPLELLVRDREVIDALLERDSDEREAFALDALRIGVVALRHVSSRLDADLLRRETTGLVDTLRQTLDGYSQTAHDKINHSLKEYFDPQNGRFQERVHSLVKQDGELARLLKAQIDGDNSHLARTMLTHVGRESPLMKLLDPQQSEGLLAALREAVEGQLTKQSEQVLREFSLDNQEGALARLVRELTTKHGDLTKGLNQKIDDVVKEFSLDEENSALSRLVKNVDRAQRTISSEFSLDNEQSAFSRLNRMLEVTQGAIHKNLTLDDDNSPLARLKKELLDLHKAADNKNQEFQQQVTLALHEMKVVRKEAERSTRHGGVFEDAVVEFVARQSQHVGDIAIPTGASTGLIKHRKTGDCVIELGPNSAAEGEKIVVEAKQQAGYNLATVRIELERARLNRGAAIGIFVFSKRLAPVGFEAFQHFGSDIICVWDPDDAETDIWLTAALVTARAISFRKSRSSETQQADFESIDKAILAIEKHAGNLSAIQTSAETIQNGAKKILKRVEIDKEAFENQLAILREKMDEVRDAIGCAE